MRIIDDVIATLDLNARIIDIRLGVFQTAVLTRNCGLASTPHDSDVHQHGESAVTESGALLGKSVKELVDLAKSKRSLEAAIGMATINSLLDVDESRCKELNAAVLLQEKGVGKKVAIVGHFPFIPKLRQNVGQLWVLEKNQHEGDYPAEAAGDILPEADVIGLTGTTLLNGTFDELIGYSRKDAYIVMLGGTTPLSPVLLDYGINAIAGTLVIEPETVLQTVSQGATFRQIKGRKSLVMM